MQALCAACQSKMPVMQDSGTDRCSGEEPVNAGVLKERLDGLISHYDSRFIDTDPVALLHRFQDPRDCEVAGLAISSLAYGSASQIIRSAEAMLSITGPSPSSFAENLTIDEAEHVFQSFKHRWTDGSDMVRLWLALGDILRCHGSLGAFAESLDNPTEDTIENLMNRFSAAFTLNQPGFKSSDRKRKPPSYLIPAPSSGSACKRLALFFRWMVRGPDGIDLGLWRFISPARLVIPLDRHIARMGRRLGLTRQNGDNWKTALDITAALRSLDPRDPLRYDFALVRPGITGACPPQGNGCGGCMLEGMCKTENG